MILDAMRTVDAEGVAMCDMHCDLEVFRVRLGKALNYQYSEDTQAGLFYRRVPREGQANAIQTPALGISPVSHPRRCCHGH